MPSSLLFCLQFTSRWRPLKVGQQKDYDQGPNHSQKWTPPHQNVSPPPAQWCKVGPRFGGIRLGIRPSRRLSRAGSIKTLPILGLRYTCTYLRDKKKIFFEGDFDARIFLDRSAVGCFGTDCVVICVQCGVVVQKVPLLFIS